MSGQELREAIARELALHFGRRTWAEMSDDRATLRRNFRANDHMPESPPFDMDEPTRSDCRDAADAIIALSPSLSEDEARELLRAILDADLGFPQHARLIGDTDAPLRDQGVEKAVARLLAAFRGSGVSPNPGPTQNPKKD